MLQAEQLIEGCLRGKPLTQETDGASADLRTAISRLYYSVFLASCDLLLDLGYEVTSKGTCHGIVKTAMEESGEPLLDRVASDYGTLGTLRRKADYNLNNKEVEDVVYVEKQLALCKSALESLKVVREKIKLHDYRNKLIESIEAWRQKDSIRDIWRKK